MGLRQCVARHLFGHRERDGFPNSLPEQKFAVKLNPDPFFFLSGSVDKQCVEVTNCFCVPHKEYDERVEADLQYAQDMFELNKKVAPGEQLVGWFATGQDITSHSALIHDYYARETK